MDKKILDELEAHRVQAHQLHQDQLAREVEAQQRIALETAFWKDVHVRLIQPALLHTKVMLENASYTRVAVESSSDANGIEARVEATNAVTKRAKRTNLRGSRLGTENMACLFFLDTQRQKLPGDYTVQLSIDQLTELIVQKVM